jgi:glucosamine-6-phosphate deaminase
VKPSPNIIQGPEWEQREKIPVRVFPDAVQASKRVADQISDALRKSALERGSLVLGLATGSTPIGLYRELVRMHREEGLSFEHVTTFNLDEYFPISPTHPESYHTFMREHLFDHVDIREENIHIPDGSIDRSDAFAACAKYEQKIKDAGGIDLQILGIGRTGHVGFNEPGSTSDSLTRLVSLDRITRRDAARDFLGEPNVPRYAITMGLATILEAKDIVLMAWGDAKAVIVSRAVEGPVSETVAATFLQRHPNARLVVDRAAAADLTRFKHPWLTGSPEWTPPLTRSAVVWLSNTVGKPVLKLVDEEYGEHGMGGLLTENGPAYNLNIRVFNDLQHTITGWPGGKPEADDTSRPERASPYPKRVVIFSAEPQDDVLYMGGTLRRLVNQGHDVHVIYQTSGSLAVPDDDALKYAECFLGFSRSVVAASSDLQDHLARLTDDIFSKKPFDADSPAVRRLKAVVRRSEALAAARVCGVDAAHLSFLDLPFYETGRYRNFKLTDRDCDEIASILDAIRPHQIYAAGGLSDPNSVQAICFEAFRGGFRSLENSCDWVESCRVWLYRETQREWNPDEIDMAVPLSPDELAVKIKAIYQHQSQRHQVPSEAAGYREAWQQVESRNRQTANLYDGLGLAEYEAIEAFKRWK